MSEVNNNKPVTPPPAVSGPNKVNNVTTSPADETQEVAKAALPPKVRNAFNDFPLTRKGTDKVDRGPKVNQLLADGFGILSGDDGGTIA